MELTDRHLEIIRKVARTVDYGSVTINISTDSNKLDLNVQNRIRLENEPEERAYSSKHSSPWKSAVCNARRKSNS